MEDDQGVSLCSVTSVIPECNAHSRLKDQMMRDWALKTRAKISTSTWMVTTTTTHRSHP